MDCVSCITPTRQDRPHTFFHHERASCPTCKSEREGRVVLRGEEPVRLLFCETCGPSEEILPGTSKAYVERFLARGELPEGFEGEAVFKETTSTCPECLTLLPVDVVIRKNQVFFKKNCPTCGPSEALVSEDAK
jgi:hypothetical protein